MADEKSFLLRQAARFRWLAQQVLDDGAEAALLSLAAEYQERAAALDQPARGGEPQMPDSSEPA